MSKSFELVLQLLKGALDGAAVSVPDQTDWGAVYEQARRQTVQGVVLDGVRRLPSEKQPPSWLLEIWTAEQKAIEKTYAFILGITDRQRSLWEAHGIRAELLKGTVSASFYPVPEHRINGDIDWWLPGADNFRNAEKALKEEGFELEQDSDGDLHFEMEGVVTELHRKGPGAEGAEGILLMMNEHILHHALVSGIGLRQICDYHLALRHFKGSYDPVRYREELRKRGLLRWTEVLEELPPRFLELVEADGNFGLEKKRRFSGFLKRALFFVPRTPKAFAARWIQLILGRLKRK